MIGNAKPVIVTEKGEKFCFDEHNISVTVPSEAIPTGERAKMLLTATLNAPVKFSSNAIPVSAVVWLHMDKKLDKPIKLQVPHYVEIKTKDQSRALQFVMSKCHKGYNNEILPMEVVEGGEFPINESYGEIEIEHLCYICIERKISRTIIPDNKYRIVFMREKPSENLWKVDICILPYLATCLTVCIYNYFVATCFLIKYMYICTRFVNIICVHRHHHKHLGICNCNNIS